MFRILDCNRAVSPPREAKRCSLHNPFIASTIAALCYSSQTTPTPTDSCINMFVWGTKGFERRCGRTWRNKVGFIRTETYCPTLLESRWYWSRDAKSWPVRPQASSSDFVHYPFAYPGPLFDSSHAWNKRFDPIGRLATGTTVKKKLWLFVCLKSLINATRPQVLPCCMLTLTLDQITEHESS